MLYDSGIFEEENECGGGVGGGGLDGSKLLPQEGKTHTIS